jgi:hypothetical protein
MTKNNSAILNQISENRSEYVGFCRFMSNTKVHPDKLVSGTIASTSELIEGKDLLVLNDTSEFNYQHHLNYFDTDDPDIGPTGNNKDVGFFLHPGYVIDSKTGIGIGFSYIKIWNRKFDKLDKYQRDYKNQPIKEKESYRWIECGNESKKHLSRAKHITIIADRESDIYEEFIEIPDEKTDLLIRSCRDRSLHGEKEKLYERISKSTCKGSFLLNVKKHKGRKARLATIDVRFEQLKIKRPIKDHLRRLPEYFELTVVEAKEQSHSVPNGELPISWVLLTTLKVETIEQAMAVIQKYKHRWEIELLFGTMKSKGLNVELSQLETGKSLKALCIIAMISALRITQLRQAREVGDKIDARLAFKTDELVLLEKLVKTYEGKTEKQKNPHKKQSMAWAAWIIARVGGWKGYTCESPPGFKTFTIGLSRFDNMFQGYKLSNEICA